VFPSRHEEFPVAPLEAMGCGLSVAAASAPGVADIFNEGEDSGGLVAPTNDPTSLARNLARLLVLLCYKLCWTHLMSANLMAPGA
jgi:glycosyltransferase involved in cell wall biosynthesis